MQIVGMDVCEDEIRCIAHELHIARIDVPGVAADLPTSAAAPEDASTAPVPPSMHHHIAKHEKSYAVLNRWQDEHRDNPVIQVHFASMPMLNTL